MSPVTHSPGSPTTTGEICKSLLAVNPVSSLSSRKAACSGVSPSSINPTKAFKKCLRDVSVTNIPAGSSDDG